MNWKANTYYKFSEANESTIPLVESLLNAYPVTRACLDALGKPLLDQVQFAFFNSNQEFITQDEQGKDLFLVCNNQVDVLVNNQLVVQMNGPSLLGDKAVVEPESKRAATIIPSAGEICLIIKIPVGLFIRSFQDVAVSDISFTQEANIFIQLFDVIQSRLFDYVFLQKQLWEQASSTLHLLNIQLTAKMIDNYKDPKWPTEVWGKLREILANDLKIIWPVKMPLNFQYFRKGLMSFLSVKFPRGGFRGPESEYLIQKNQLWRNWLTKIAEAVVQELNEDQLPLSLGEIELFNPRNYRLRIRALLKSIESRSTPKDMVNAPEEEIIQWRENAPDIGVYFGSGEHTNAFKLKTYLDRYLVQYSLKHPYRTKAQLAQKISLIAATNENEFNKSVIKMQQFLEKVKNVVQDISVSDESTESRTTKLDTMINRVVSQFNTYISIKSGEFVETLSVVRYVKDFTPNVQLLMKTTGSSQIRNELNNTVISLGHKIGFVKPVENHFIQNNLHIAVGANQDSVPFKELNDHFWINFHSNIKLYYEDKPIMKLPDFSFLGGFNLGQEYLDQKIDIHLTVDEEIQEGIAPVNSLFFILPADKMPWNRNSVPSDNEFYHSYLPLYNLVINKQLELLSHMVVQRDLAYSELQQSFHAIRLERKVKHFENDDDQLRPPQKMLINKMLTKLLGMKINPKAEITGKKLSKVIYNSILKKLKADHPELSVEERGNKTYTKWRYTLTEVVLELEKINPAHSSDEKAPTPVFEQLEVDCLKTLKKYGISPENYRITLTGAKPSIQLEKVFNRDNCPGTEANNASSSILSLLSDNFISIIGEIVDIHHEGEEMKSQKDGSKGDDLQVRIIEDSVEELLNYLKN